MDFYQNLFVGEALSTRAEQTIEAIKLNKMTPNIYVITYASNSKNLLDVIPTWELLQPAYPKKDLIIIGLANGKKDALELVEHIVGETYAKTGSVDVKTYLQSNKEGQVWM